MCLAVPAKILHIEGHNAQVDFGDGTLRDVNISLVDVQIGSYVIVHAGFAIEVLDQVEAQATLDLWRELLSQE